MGPRSEFCFAQVATVGSFFFSKIFPQKVKQILGRFAFFPKARGSISGLISTGISGTPYFPFGYLCAGPAFIVRSNSFS
jgi:hypothetical protein